VTLIKWTVLVLYFFEVVRQMKDVLGANACPVVIPIGAEESFKGGC
ncbi:hypothetical protein OBE_00844, partial [human gut metagenome]